MTSEGSAFSSSSNPHHYVGRFLAGFLIVSSMWDGDIDYRRKESIARCNSNRSVSDPLIVGRDSPCCVDMLAISSHVDDAVQPLLEATTHFNNHCGISRINFSEVVLHGINTGIVWVHAEQSHKFRREDQRLVGPGDTSDCAKEVRSRKFALGCP